MATASAKKNPDPLDLDDLGLDALPPSGKSSAGGLGESDPMSADGGDGLAPAGEPPAPPLAPPAPILRTLTRAACVLLVVAGIVVWLLNPSAPLTAAKFDPASTVVLSLAQGASYGQVLVYLGDGAVGDPILDDEALKQALTGSLGSGKTHLLIKASGGVHQREIDRVGRIVLEVITADRKMEIHVAPLESAP